MVTRTVYTSGMMHIETDMGWFWTEPHETDSSKLILLSTERSTLESVVDNIELMGRADDYDFDDLSIQHTQYPDGSNYYRMELDRGTLALWFEFEVRYYQHVERGN